MKNMSSSAWLVECSNKLLTLLLKYIPNDIPDTEIKDIIIQQNNLRKIAEPVLNVRFTLTKFKDSRHVVVEVNPILRRELLASRGIKLNWNLCRAEDFVAVTRCFKCLGFVHTSKFCQQDDQSCSNCAGNHHRQQCNNPGVLCCTNCLKANSLIHNDSMKLNVNHSALSKECNRFKRIQSMIIISKTEY